ncbi:MAG: hypothetical protein PHO37_14455 [Kiritimatiellae bacterium]|nr:hypothetical protein [Kiritimatiellia bacterium]
MNLKNTIIHALLSIGICFSAAAEKGIPLRKFRESGDSLDISIQQEVERVVDLGVGWIKARQSADGGWGVSNQLETAALCTLALASQNNPDLTNTLQAALQYIEARFHEQSLTNFTAVAWSAAALRVTGTAGRAAELSSAWLKNPRTPLSTVESALQCELLLGLALLEAEETTLAASQERYNALAHQLNVEGATLLRMWLDARVINRAGQGQLLKIHGQRVDWRGTFARKIISTQKIDPSGGGFWSGLNSSQTLQNTALAILISKEL